MRLTSSPPKSGLFLSLSRSKRWNSKDVLQLLQDDALSVGGATKGGGLEGGTEGTLAVLLVGPALGATVSLELASGVETTRLVIT